MAITTILGTDLPSDSRTVINDNFTDLDTTKADLASPTFTGTPTLPTGTTAVTQSASDNSTAVATTAYADAGVAAATQTVFDTTEVFNGTGSTSYTDLDLSSVIGVNQKMVMLKVNMGTTGGYYSSFKMKGTSGTFPNTSNPVGTASLVLSNSGESGYVIVPTDTSGVVQWRINTGTPSYTINVVAYW